MHKPSSQKAWPLLRPGVECLEARLPTGTMLAVLPAFTSSLVDTGLEKQSLHSEVLIQRTDDLEESLSIHTAAFGSMETNWTVPDTPTNDNLVIRNAEAILLRTNVPARIPSYLPHADQFIQDGTDASGAGWARRFCHTEPRDGNVSLTHQINHIESPIPSFTELEPAEATDSSADPLGHTATYFEPNVGQMHEDVDFRVHGLGYDALLSSTEVVIRSALNESGSTPLSGADIRMQVIGGNHAAPATGVGRLPGTVNYFLGSDPAKWHTGIPTFGRVVYDDVYPGIDLVYYGNQLEYDFVVAPGSNPHQVKLGFPDADSASIDPVGNLHVVVGDNELHQKKPFVYQETEGTRREIPSRFVLDTDEVSFAIGDHDSSRPLIIDPVLSYSTYLGGSGDDFSRDIRTDSAGNIYVAGHTSSLNFPATNGWQSGHGGGSVDAFVTKFSANGSTLVYSSYLGGSGDDFGGRLAVDGAGNVYLSGDTTSTDFPTANAVQPSNHGGADAFVTKLSANGSLLRYSTYLGGSTDDDGRGVAVDRFGNAYVTGRTTSADFPIVNAVQSQLRGGKDAFVTKLRPDGSAFGYSTYLGGSGSAEEGYSIAVDPIGNASIAGRTDSFDFPTVNAIQPIAGGGIDAFVTRLTADGSALIYSTFLGGSADDHGRRIAVDSAGNAYVAGETFSTNFPTRNAFQPFSAGGNDAFVTKLSANGSNLIYSTYLGGTLNDQAIAVAVDVTGNAVVTGGTESGNFPVLNAIQPSKNGNTDVFVTKLTVNGTHLAYSTYLGGSSSDFGVGITADRFGNAYVTGHTFSTDYPLVNAFQSIHKGGSDAFVSKIRSMTRALVVVK